MNVELDISDVAKAKWPVDGTLVAESCVVPILTSRTTDTVQLVSRHRGSVNVYNHSVDLGFSITFHKVQGQTLQKVILDLNKRPFRPGVWRKRLLRCNFKSETRRGYACPSAEW